MTSVEQTLTSGPVDHPQQLCAEVFMGWRDLPSTLVTRRVHPHGRTVGGVHVSHLLGYVIQTLCDLFKCIGATTVDSGTGRGQLASAAINNVILLPGVLLAYGVMKETTIDGSQRPRGYIGIGWTQSLFIGVLELFYDHCLVFSDRAVINGGLNVTETFDAEYFLVPSGHVKAIETWGRN